MEIRNYVMNGQFSPSDGQGTTAGNPIDDLTEPLRLPEGRYTAYIYLVGPANTDPLKREAEQLRLQYRQKNIPSGVQCTVCRSPKTGHCAIIVPDSDVA